MGLPVPGPGLCAAARSPRGAVRQRAGRVSCEQMSTPRLVLLPLLGAVACGTSPEPTIDAPPPPIDGPIDNGTTDVEMIRIGNPAWETTGWELAATPTWETNYQVWSQHRYDSASNAFTFGTAHAPPYDAEIDEALARLGLDPGRRFPRSAMQAPRNLIAFGVIVPSATAPVGSTLDYASGPYLHADLRIHVDGDMYYMGGVVDPDFDSDYPTYRTLNPGLTVDGSSHLPLTFGESTEFIPGDPGTYALVVNLTDLDHPADGWRIFVRFTID